MSVRTTADEKVAEAKEHVDKALRALNEVIVLRCWGHEEYRPEYREALKDSFEDLLVIRDRFL